VAWTPVHPGLPTERVQMQMIERVLIMPEAAAVVDRLRASHGPLMFHQSGGCCDGSSPMCYQQGEFHTGAQDILLGEVAGCPFFMGVAQFAHWQHTQLIIDVVKGRGSGFSLEAPEGVRFLTRSRLFTEEEVKALAVNGVGSDNHPRR
jgi:uncharacterized protein